MEIIGIDGLSDSFYISLFSAIFFYSFAFKIDINCLCGTVLGSNHVNLILHKRKIEYEFHYIVSMDVL